MPLYETQTESGRTSIRLLALRFAEQDIQTYGALERSEAELKERVRVHVADLLSKEDAPSQAIVTDDVEELTRLLTHSYATIYAGLLVGYTGLREPFRFPLEPRYTTSVNLDGTEDEQMFVGLQGLRTIIAVAQASRREHASADGYQPDTYLLTMIQVTVYDAEEEEQEQQSHFLCYDLEGEQILGCYERTNLLEEVLHGLELPFADTPDAILLQRRQAKHQ